jgi:phosphatidylinositol 3,5-bisphosphate 5-phosphatase
LYKIQSYSIIILIDTLVFSGTTDPNLPATMSAPADMNAPPATVHISVAIPTPNASSEKSTTPSVPPKEPAPPIASSIRAATSPLPSPNNNNQRETTHYFSAPTSWSTPTVVSQTTSTKKHTLTETPPNTEQPLLNKFILYESKTKFYVVASNTNDSRHRMLKIDRTNQDELDVEHNDITYTGRQMNAVIKMLEDGNRHTGGLGRPRVFFGIAGAHCSPSPFLHT